MTTTDPYVLGIDSSTTATKAIVWDNEGHSVAEGRAKIPVARPGRGLYEAGGLVGGLLSRDPSGCGGP